MAADIKSQSPAGLPRNSHHGRIEERLCGVIDAGWLAERHPDWKALRSLAAITARRVDKKSGFESVETRLYITSLEADTKAIPATILSHWGIENSLHSSLDVTIDEDRCRTRKDDSPLNLAIIHHAGMVVRGSGPACDTPPSWHTCSIEWLPCVSCALFLQ
jgi:hypothetical protein